MALTRTLQGTADLANQTDGGSHDGTIDCGTVTSGGILMVHAGGTGGSAGTTWTTPTKSSGTATIGTAVQVGTTAGGGTYESTVMVWRIPITGSGTLVLSTGDASTSFGAHFHAIQYTGQDSTTPIAGAVVQTGTTSLANSTLGATPTADDEVVSAINFDTNAEAGKGIAAGTNFTERYDTGATDDFVQMQTATRAGSVSTSTTVVWGTADGTPTTFTAAGVAYIVKAAAVSPSGTMAVTQAAQTSTISGTLTLTATMAVTQADQTMSATGTSGTTATGSMAVTQADQTSSASGTITFTGSMAVTQADQTMSASGTAGTITLTGSMAVTQAAQTSAATGLNAVGLWPTSIDGTNKRILDQNGDPLFMVGDSAWSLVGQLGTTDITTYFTEIDAKGFTATMFSAPEAYYTDNTPAYRNAAGNDPFSGTAFASSLVDAYWDVVDHAITKAAELGITCIIVPQYSGYADSADGWSVDVEAAYDASTANLTTYGAALATRYASYPNIVWLLGHDRVPTQKFKAASKLIADELASGTSHMIIHGGWHTSSTSSTGDTDWNAVTGTDITTDFDTVYVYDETSGEAVESAIATKTSIFLEGKYEQEQSQVVGDQTLREQMWEPLMAGASGAFFGNNPRWHFESGKELYAFSGTWQNSLTNTTYNDGTVHASYLASFLGSVSGVLTSTPDTTDTFLVSGTGWARFSTTVGLVYQTAAASITVDTTELAGTGNVRIRRFDPTDGSFTTVAASEAQNATRAISHPGANANGDNDYVYVVDLTSDASGTMAVTQAAQTSSITGTITLTGSMAVTQAAQTSAITGVESFTATMAVTQADQTSAATGVESFTATVAVTQEAQTSTVSGTITFTATMAVTQADQTMTASGIAGSNPTAVMAVTQADQTSTISGTLTVTCTATMAVTQEAQTMSATGTDGSVVVLVYGPALAADPPPILTFSPPPILAHTPPPILKGRSS